MENDLLIAQKEIQLDELKLAKKKQELKILQLKKEVEKLISSISSSDEAIKKIEEEILELKTSN